MKSENRPQNYGAPWTDEANEELLDLFDTLDDPDEIARCMGRTRGAVIGQLERLDKVVNDRGRVYKKTFWFDSRNTQCEPPGVREVAHHRFSADRYLANPFNHLKDKHVSAFIKELENFRREGAQYTLEQWQEPCPDFPGYTRPASLLNRVIACNLGGWLAVSPSFRAGGGRATTNGQPEIRGEYGEYAIAEWFGIPVEIAGALVGASYPGYYDKVDVSTLEKALEALYRMKETGNPGLEL